MSASEKREQAAQLTKKMSFAKAIDGRLIVRDYRLICHLRLCHYGRSDERLDSPEFGVEAARGSRSRRDVK